MRNLFIFTLLLSVFIGVPALFIVSAPLTPPYYLDIYHRDPLPPGAVSIATITNLSEARSYWMMHEGYLDTENTEMRELEDDVTIIQLGLGGDKRTLRKIADGVMTTVAAAMDKSRAATVASAVLTIFDAPGSKYNLKVKLIEKYVEIENQQTYVDKAAQYRDEFYDCFVLFWKNENSDSNLPPGKIHTPEQGDIPEEVCLKCVKCPVEFCTPTYSLSSLVYESENNHKRICGQGTSTAPGHVYYSCRPGNHNQWIAQCQVTEHTSLGLELCKNPYGYWLCVGHIHTYTGRKFKISEDPEPTPSQTDNSPDCDSCTGSCSACADITYPCGVHSGPPGNASGHGRIASCSETNGWGHSCNATHYMCEQTQTHTFPTFQCGNASCTQAVADREEHRSWCINGNKYWTCSTTQPMDPNEYHRTRTCTRYKELRQERDPLTGLNTVVWGTCGERWDMCDTRCWNVTGGFGTHQE